MNNFLGNNKHASLIYLLCMCFCIVFLVTLIARQEKRHAESMATLLSDVTYIQNEQRLADMGIDERKEAFRKVMLRILTVHGHEYRKDNIKAMDRNTKLKYIDLCYEGAEDFNFEYYWVPAIHKKESSFNPIQDGPTGEKGIGQQQWGTALSAQGALKTLPKYLRKKYHFEILKHEDLYDPIVSTKVTFVLLYVLRDYTRGDVTWMISLYKWGGFLWRYFDKNKGTGTLPAKFVISGVDYNVAGYYSDWMMWNESFTRNDMNPGMNVSSRWREQKKKMLADEVRLNTANAEMKKIRMKLSKRDKEIDELTKANKELEEAVATASNKFKEIYGQAENYDGKDIRKLLRKGKGVTKEFLSSIDDKGVKTYYATASAIFLLLVFFLCIFLIGIKIVFQKLFLIKKRLFNG